MEMTHALNTVRSAKDFFFPQTENLVDFKVKGKEIEIIDPRTEHEDFVIFGVRACDAAVRSRCWTRCSWPIPWTAIISPAASTAPLSPWPARTRRRPASAPCSASIPLEPEGDARCWMDEKNLYIEAVHRKGRSTCGVR